MGVPRVLTGLLMIAMCFCSSTFAAVIECEGLDKVECSTSCNSQSCAKYLDGDMKEPDQAICDEECKASTSTSCGCLDGKKSQKKKGIPFPECVPKEECGCKVGEEYIMVGETAKKPCGTYCKCGTEIDNVCTNVTVTAVPRGRKSKR